MSKRKKITPKQLRQEAKKKTARRISAKYESERGSFIGKLVKNERGTKEEGMAICFKCHHTHSVTYVYERENAIYRVCQYCRAQLLEKSFPEQAKIIYTPMGNKMK